MGGEEWELKSPIGAGRWVINNIQNALKQSSNIILDLHRLKRPQEKALREVDQIFRKTRRLKKIIILKNNEIIEFKKKE